MSPFFAKQKKTSNSRNFNEAVHPGNIWNGLWLEVKEENRSHASVKSHVSLQNHGSLSGNKDLINHGSKSGNRFFNWFLNHLPSTGKQPDETTDASHFNQIFHYCSFFSYTGASEQVFQFFWPPFGDLANPCHFPNGEKMSLSWKTLCDWNILVSGYRWSTWTHWHSWLVFFAKDTPCTSMSHCSQHQQELGCAPSS